MVDPGSIRTTRLKLVPATPDLARVELHDVCAFAAELSARVPADWPPDELADARILFLCLLEANPSWTGWLGWYALEQDTEEEADAQSSPGWTLVGSAGFKGPPDKEGAVEIGYSLLPAYQGRGYATEMTAALMDWASRRGAREIQAHVNPANRPSLRVIEKLGFEPMGSADERGTILHTRRVDVTA